MLLTIPNILTLLRIALIPALFIIFWLPYPWANPLCAIVFSVVALTDWLDGYLARRLQQYSNFGAFLDPVADKLMVSAALILILCDDPSVWLAIPVAIIIGREIVISALREWMAELGKRATVAVSLLGKIKTTFQMLAIAFLLYQQPLFGIPLYWVGFVLLQIAACLTLFSMLIYLRSAWPYMVS